MTAPKAEVKEWIKKAEMDYASALKLSTGKKRLHEIVCFHCQQTAEKYIKAYLLSCGLRFGKIHDLERLNFLCIRRSNLFKSLEEPARLLSIYAVDVRYPGASATSAEAVQALKAARVIRKFVHRQLAGSR